MQRFLKILAALTLTATTMFAATSDASFPKDWASFTKVTTPLTTIGALPGCDADVSSLPAIYQETVATYCALKQGGPGAVEVLVSDKEAFKSRTGNYKDNTFFILNLKELKVLFVTQWKDNKPLYGIYTHTGQDAANVLGSGLNPQDCKQCHTGYQAFCINGQCATLQ